MPGMDGPALCREVRMLPRENYTYIVLLTSLEGKSNYLEAMDAGADDFMTKPFDADQLKGRIHVAERIIGLQRRVAEGARELREKNEQMVEDLKMARELQMALLPQHFPTIPRGAPPMESAIKFSSFYYPMAAVSGDFFTVNRLSDTSVAVFIADVMGHGIRAALITAMVRAFVDKFNAAAANPAAMLTNMNRSLLAILKHTESALFVTGFYLVADTARSRIRYANVAHPEPLLLHRLRGDLESISAKGGGGPPLACLMTPNTRTASIQWQSMILSCFLPMGCSKWRGPTMKCTVTSAWWPPCGSASACHPLSCWPNSLARSGTSPRGSNFPMTFASWA